MESILPTLYEYVTDEIVENTLSHWRSFYNTFDGWSKYGRRFVSQHYHGIDDRTFEYKCVLLDLIALGVNHYQEVLAGALVTRQEYWTGRISSPVQPLRAGGVADGASDMQGAGALAFGEADQSRCQCHGVNSVYTDVRAADLTFCRDLNILFQMVAFVVGNSTIYAALRVHQITNDMCALQLTLANATRWDGELSAVQRVIELEKSLAVLIGEKEYIKWSASVHDFLREAFFARLKSYVPVLMSLRLASKLYQSQGFPSGCFVPLVIDELRRICCQQNGDLEPVSELKRSLLAAIQRRLVPILEPPAGETTSFLMAAALHPGVWATLRARGAVSESVQEATIDGLILEARNLLHDESAMDLLPTVLANVYVQRIVQELDVTAVKESLDLSELVTTAKVCNVQHMEFWRSVVLKQHQNQLSLQMLVPLAAMVLALPASEAIDESVFSRTGRLLTKSRTSLSDPNVERITVIRMYTETFSLSINKLNSWVRKALERAAREERK